MHIEHLAVWTKDLEKMRTFYEKYFQATSSNAIVIQKHNFNLTF